MKRRTQIGLIWVAAMVCSGGIAAERIAEFKGSRSKDTMEFEIEAPWILDWRVGGEFVGSIAVDVSLLEAGTGVHRGNVLKTKNAGNGVRLFDEGGRFYFRVSSTMAEWTLRVEQLTREEAEQYTPRQAGDER